MRPVRIPWTWTLMLPGLLICVPQPSEGQPVPPPAERGNHVSVYHGIRVADPYRWMEDMTSARVNSSFTVPEQPPAIDTWMGVKAVGESAGGLPELFAAPMRPLLPHRSAEAVAWVEEVLQSRRGRSRLNPAFFLVPGPDSRRSFDPCARVVWSEGCP